MNTRYYFSGSLVFCLSLEKEIASMLKIEIVYTSDNYKYNEIAILGDGMRIILKPELTKILQ